MDYLLSLTQTLVAYPPPADTTVTSPTTHTYNSYWPIHPPKYLQLLAHPFSNRLKS